MAPFIAATIKNNENGNNDNDSDCDNHHSNRSNDIKT